MKSISTLILMLLLSSNLIVGQGYVIEYKVSERANQKKGMLYVDEKQSIYRTFSLGSNSSGNSTQSKPDNEVIADAMKNVEAKRATVNTTNKPILYRNLSAENTVIFVESFIPQRPVVEDTWAIQHWQISTETKQLGKYNCVKATGAFRGREYTVWFAKELPISAGPWKLAGLPGIILEAESVDGFYKFTFVNLTKATSIPEDLNHPIKGTPITYNDYLVEANKHYQTDVNTIYEETSKGFMAKFLGASTSPVSMNINHIEKGLEKKYTSSKISN